jgi:hypothetical protein
LRVVGYIGLSAVIGVAVGLLSSGGPFHKVLVGVLVGAGMLILGLFILLGRSGSPGPEA